MEKRAEWAAQACSANQAISLFPVQTSKLIPSLGIIIDQLRSVGTSFLLTVDGGQVKRGLSGFGAAVDAAVAAAAAPFVEEHLEASVGGGRGGRDVHQRLPFRVGLDVAC